MSLIFRNGKALLADANGVPLQLPTESYVDAMERANDLVGLAYAIVTSGWTHPAVELWDEAQREMDLEEEDFKEYGAVSLEGWDMLVAASRAIVAAHAAS